METQTLFRAGEHGFHTYRIPSLLTLQSGTVLALAEGRRQSASDTGNIAVVLRRSVDGGRTWGELTVVSECAGVTGNPCPVQDVRTGRLLLLLCRNNHDGPEADILMGRAPRTVWICQSDDDGATWSEAREITQQVKRPEWTWYATGPGHGVQMDGGRLVVACDHAVHPEALGHTADRALELADSLYRAHLILSDDGGDSWRIGAVSDVEGTNESAVVGMGACDVYVNSRYHGSEVRHGSWSSDGGESFAEARPHCGMTDPVCQGSALRVGGEVLIAQPAGPARTRLTLHRSTDGGTVFHEAAILCAGHAAYSDLCQVGDDLLCLFETGEEHAYERLDLLRFALK